MAPASTLTDAVWRKSTRSSQDGNCVEAATVVLEGGTFSSR